MNPQAGPGHESAPSREEFVKSPEGVRLAIEHVFDEMAGYATAFFKGQPIGAGTSGQPVRLLVLGVVFR
jgi:hypothetical protein